MREESLRQFIREQVNQMYEQLKSELTSFIDEKLKSLLLNPQNQEDSLQESQTIVKPFEAMTIYAITQ